MFHVPHSASLSQTGLTTDLAKAGHHSYAPFHMSLLLSKAGLRCNSMHTSRLYFLWNCPSMATLVPSISPKHHMVDFLRLNNTHESSLLKVLFSPLYVTCIPGKIQVSLLLFPKVPLHSEQYPRVKGQGQACVCIY